MFKKLKSLLFTEEEIVIEEEISKHDDALKIPELRPIVAKPAVEKPAVRPVVEKKAEPEIVEPVFSQFVAAAEPIKTLEPTDRKAVNIQADDALTIKQQKVRKEMNQLRREEYQPKDIISPIFGGTQKGTEPIGKAPSKTQTYADAKQRTPVTNVISPIFGKVIPEYDVDSEAGQKMMDLDITEMLSPERTDEEVQVSLYDYLEDLNHDKE